MDFVWDLAQQRQITRNRRGVGQADRRAGRALAEAESAAERLERLTLITHAMWELLAERLGLSERELMARIEEIDLRDGVRDGKLASVGTPCRSCNRITHRRHAKCLYCGAALAKRAF